MTPRQKRLLLAVDGSERALQTVRYAGEEDAFKGMKIVLFHVFNSIPDAYYDLEKEPKSVKVVTHVRSWETQQKKNISKFMDDARQMLLDAGHAEPAVEIKIQNRKKGVARDIVIEAQKGYDAVLIRRRGATALKNIVVGSVTNKLLEKLSFIPVLIAGRKPVNKKVLVAVDGSPCATKAVQFVADMLGPLGNHQVKLVYVVRGGNASDADALAANGIHETEPIFKPAVNILTAAGFPPENISTKTITGVLSRAGAIVDKTEKGGWGTIVVGRRGLSSVSDFFMGRVSNKVVHAGRKDTVWIVT
ncbi:universal stress protein [Desulfosarcina sp.]|uniref:universal stress protein n=1 Tax=Desulfosarcina sp. TaxID=2027861 RepID=UPI0029B4E61E|nr:universal stress protein [Desulfosarcina sp.]MDX2452663.1 universal stress protein [Desulfosarcina sp.]MDX2490441.1 universal stress protein [Desulfosarcina sp.]